MPRIRDQSAATPCLDPIQWEALKKDINERSALWKRGDAANFVPEEWAAKALALAGVSEASLGYLTRNLRAKGRLTLQHALFFIGLEDKVIAQARAAAPIAASLRKTTSVQPVQRLRLARTASPRMAPAVRTEQTATI